MARRVAILAALVLLSAVGWAVVDLLRLPSAEPLAKRNPDSTALIDLRAREAAEAKKKPRRKQRWVELRSIAPHAVEAVVLAEDAAFRAHQGVDTDELRKVMGQAFEKGELGRGASTITQQLAKNLWLSTDRSIWRKAKELLLARRLEAALSKDRILSLYLNVVEWGEGVYGIEAAAREHFEVNASQLSVAQAAMLAGMLPSPRRWLPAGKPAVLHRRAVEVVDRLERFGRIDSAAAATARAELSAFFQAG